MFRENLLQCSVHVVVNERLEVGGHGDSRAVGSAVNEHRVGRRRRRKRARFRYHREKFSFRGVVAFVGIYEALSILIGQARLDQRRVARLGKVRESR